MEDSVTIARQVQEEVKELSGGQTWLMIVSKNVGIEDIRRLYDAGFRDFGERYAQELEKKAEALPNEIRWHFIGQLQTNKCERLTRLPNLCTIQSVDSEEKAKKLNKPRQPPLRIYIQVNTSEEPQKAGTQNCQAALVLARFIVASCEHLHLEGLMTIGSVATSQLASGPNEEFQRLVDCKRLIEQSVPQLKRSLRLSMGMSADYRQGIAQGAACVRIGSKIFAPHPSAESSAAS